MAQFDPSDASVDEVQAKLEKAKPEERDRILAAERSGKARKTILEPYGIDPNERVDDTGRVLYPWEVTGDQMADADQHPEETDEQRKAREAQAEQDAKAAAAHGSTGDQGGVTPAGSGTATGGAGAAATTGGTATGTTGTTTGATAGSAAPPAV